MENGFIESFNGRLRDECLNVDWFTSLEEARRGLNATAAEEQRERYDEDAWQPLIEGWADRLRPPGRITRGAPSVEPLTRGH